MPLAVIALLVLGAPVVLAGTSCLGYLDENGSWHPGFSCPAFTFCCGTCHRRYCCGDLNLLLSKWQQKRCQGLRWAGLATPMLSGCPPSCPAGSTHTLMGTLGSHLVTKLGIRAPRSSLSV